MTENLNELREQWHRDAEQARDWRETAWQLIAELDIERAECKALHDGLDRAYAERDKLEAELDSLKAPTPELYVNATEGKSLVPELRASRFNLAADWIEMACQALWADGYTLRATSSAMNAMLDERGALRTTIDRLEERSANQRIEIENLGHWNANCLDTIEGQAEMIKTQVRNIDLQSKEIDRLHAKVDGLGRQTERMYVEALDRGEDVKALVAQHEQDMQASGALAQRLWSDLLGLDDLRTGLEKHNAELILTVDNLRASLNAATKTIEERRLARDGK